MPLKLNPFTAQFDLTGSSGGASYIDGEVATYNDLSLSSTTAPLDSAWLVRTASGVWPVARKQAGIYIRTATGGSSRDADWTYAGTMPDVFSDANFTVYDDVDTSKNLKFQLSGLATGTTSTLTVPASGTIARTSDIPSTFAASAITSGVFDNARINFAAPSAIGSTAASSGAFTTLSASSTVSGTGFSTYLASPPNIGTTTPAEINGSTIRASGGVQAGTIGSFGILYGANLRLGSDQVISWNSVSANPSGAFADTVLVRDAANILALRNGVNASSFRIYNTYTDASNYERGFIGWTSNTFRIGIEAAGTGSSRTIEFYRGASRCAFIDSSNFFNADSGFLTAGQIRLGAAQPFYWNNRAVLRSPATDQVTLLNSAETDFGRLNFGGTTSSFPALKRSSTALQVRLADDSADAPLSCSGITVGVGSETAPSFKLSNSSLGIYSRGAGEMTFTDGAEPQWRYVSNALYFNSDFLLGWGNSTTAPVSVDTLLRRDTAGVLAQYNGGNAQAYRLYNTFTSTTSFERLNIRWATNECIIDAEAGSGGGTLRGIKLGSATSSLLGFYGATPAAQPAAVADATDAASVITQLNALLSRLRTIGVIAT